jgi:prephenate dehydrogenase
MMRRVLIVGTGLIGASAGLALRAAGFDGEIVGTGPTEQTLTIAKERGAIDAWVARTDADSAAANADLILLAGPVLSILDWMQRLAPVLGEHQLVTDVGSTKVQIAELAATSDGGQGTRWRGTSRGRTVSRCHVAVYATR